MDEKSGICDRLFRCIKCTIVDRIPSLFKILLAGYVLELRLRFHFNRRVSYKAVGRRTNSQKTALVPWESLALETVWMLRLSLLELKFHVNRRHGRGTLAMVPQVDTYSCWEETPCLWVSGRGIVSLWSDLPCICCPQSNHPCKESSQYALAHRFHKTLLTSLPSTSRGNICWHRCLGPKASIEKMWTSYNTIQYHTISFILRRIQIIVNISSFKLFTENKYKSSTISYKHWLTCTDSMLHDIWTIRNNYREETW